METADNINQDAGQQPAPRAHGQPKLVWILLALVVVVAAAIGGWVVGRQQAKPAAPAQEITIKVPSEATVIAECIEGIGKQYVLPKDIPFGPIYNVHNGRVVGIEYMFNITELTNNPGRFMNLAGFSHEFDHINIDTLPIGHAGHTEMHFHVDLFTISADEAAKIKCAPEHQDITH